MKELMNELQCTAAASTDAVVTITTTAALLLDQYRITNPIIPTW